MTPATRKAAERQRKRDAGLRPVEVWIHPRNRAKLARFLASLKW